MASKTENPTEIFKRAIAHAARSLAEQPDLEVTFSGDGPALNGALAGTGAMQLLFCLLFAAGILASGGVGR